MTYKSLNDAQALAGPGLAQGNVEVWYQKDMTQGMGHVATPAISCLDSSHVLLGSIAESRHESVFMLMQGEVWSPQGQARELIQARGLRHTSMSVGDVIGTQTGRDKTYEYFMVASVGFVKLSHFTRS